MRSVTTMVDALAACCFTGDCSEWLVSGGLGHKPGTALADTRFLWEQRQGPPRARVKRGNVTFHPGYSATIEVFPPSNRQVVVAR